MFMAKIGCYVGALGLVVVGAMLQMPECLGGAVLSFMIGATVFSVHPSEKEIDRLGR